MVIRKLFRFEGAHIVRNCTSIRCRENIHGHSYVVEVFITSDKLDKGCMVMDFARLDKVRQFVDSFDHAYSLWIHEKEEIKEFIHNYNRRVVDIPLSPTAEGYALMFLAAAIKLVEEEKPVNGEKNVKVQSVRVHETVTGYAEAYKEDLILNPVNLKEIKFSEGVIEEWKNKELWK